MRARRMEWDGWNGIEHAQWAPEGAAAEWSEEIMEEKSRAEKDDTLEILCALLVPANDDASVIALPLYCRVDGFWTENGQMIGRRDDQLTDESTSTD